MKILKNRKMKGTVLLTVVSVMALMIVFMTTTLVLANAANKRAHRSYSASQAEYTARAAIENFTEAMHRNPAMVAALQNEVNTVGATKDVNVAISDPTGASLGHIGYYDSSGNWVADKIQIQNTGEKYVRADGGSGEEWIPVDVVRISATARVGKEEKSVVAYINKRGSKSNPDSTKVKGLNTAGGAHFPNGGTFTGGLGIGLSEFVLKDYSFTNDAVIDTTLSFINGSVSVATSTFRVEVNSNRSETIVMGDLLVSNDKLVNLQYTPVAGETFTQKETPYLFVLGKLGFPASPYNPGGYAGSKLSIGKVTGGNVGDADVPFNLFVGSIDIPTAASCNNSVFACDVYMMDESADNHFISTNAQKLYDWSSSLVDGSTQFESHGGNIYCAGNLEIGGFDIDGDLRVAKNLTLNLNGRNVTVYGDIVCGGNITIEGSGTLSVTGTVYAANADTLPVANKDTYTAYQAANGKAYPDEMTLKSILGDIDTHTGQLTSVAPDTTKIIKTLDEVRHELGYDPALGGFDEVYPDSIDDLGAPGADIRTQVGYNSPLTNVTGPITASCTIGSFQDSQNDVIVDTTGGKDLIVVLKGNITFGKNGVAAGNGVGNRRAIKVIGDGTVKFFIDGNLTLDNGCIVHQKVLDAVAAGEIDEHLAIPVDFYGAIGSSLNMVNNGLVTGSFKMPFTKFSGKCSGPLAVTYKSDTGKHYTGNPSIIGNALFDDVTDAQNQFEMYYTEAGGTGYTGGFSTELGYYDIAYFSGS